MLEITPTDTPHAEAQTYRFGFVLQQVLGWISVYHNFRRFVDQDPSVIPTWAEVTYSQPNQLLDRVPLVPERVRGALDGVIQVHQALGTASLPLVGALTASQYDAVLFNSQSLCLTARRYLSRVPAVIVTDVTPRQLDELRPFYGRSPAVDTPASRYKHRAYRDIFTSAQAIAPCSHWVKRSLMADYGVPEERIVVVPHGVDVEQWAPPPAGVREHSQQGSAGLPRILFVGGDFDRKGGQLLFDWYLQRGLGHCELHMVTRTPPVVPPNVSGLHVYTGLEANDPQLIRLYHEAHLFVLPTRADCFGVASIEAMATGLPVITTMVGGVPEIVDDGHDGFLIAPEDSRLLGERIELLLSNPTLRQAMGQHARATVLQRFDARDNAHRLIELMKQIASKDGTGGHTPSGKKD